MTQLFVIDNRLRPFRRALDRCTRLPSLSPRPFDAERRPCRSQVLPLGPLSPRRSARQLGIATSGGRLSCVPGNEDISRPPCLPASRHVVSCRLQAAASAPFVQPGASCRTEVDIWQPQVSSASRRRDVLWPSVQYSRDCGYLPATHGRRHLGTLSLLASSGAGCAICATVRASFRGSGRLAAAGVIGSPARRRAGGRHG